MIPVETMELLKTLKPSKYYNFGTSLRGFVVVNVIPMQAISVDYKYHDGMMLDPRVVVYAKLIDLHEGKKPVKEVRLKAGEVHEIVKQCKTVAELYNALIEVFK